MKVYLNEKVKNLWETCRPVDAHLQPEGRHIDKKTMLNRYKNVLDIIDYDFKNKKVIDYGCGGGWLGIYLFEEKEINYYYGLDLAKRSLKEARKNLKKYKNKTIKKMHLAVLSIVNIDKTIDFSKYEADILICLACMIHFPSIYFLLDFLKACDNSNCEKLIFEIRDKNIGTYIDKKAYDTKIDFYTACLTDEKFISSCLYNYELETKTDNIKHPTGCQLLYYKRLDKNDDKEIASDDSN